MRAGREPYGGNDMLPGLKLRWVVMVECDSDGSARRTLDVDFMIDDNDST